MLLGGVRPPHRQGAGSMAAGGLTQWEEGAQASGSLIGLGAAEYRD